jgi:hypothetical protein
MSGRERPCSKNLESSRAVGATRGQRNVDDDDRKDVWQP